MGMALPRVWLGTVDVTGQAERLLHSQLSQLCSLGLSLLVCRPGTSSISAFDE